MGDNNTEFALLGSSASRFLAFQVDLPCGGNSHAIHCDDENPIFVIRQICDDHHRKFVTTFTGSG